MSTEHQHQHRDEFMVKDHFTPLYGASARFRNQMMYDDTYEDGDAVGSAGKDPDFSLLTLTTSTSNSPSPRPLRSKRQGLVAADGNEQSSRT